MSKENEMSGSEQRTPEPSEPAAAPPFNEDKERREFEKWATRRFAECLVWLDQNRKLLFEVWKAARARQQSEGK